MKFLFKEVGIPIHAILMFKPQKRSVGEGYLSQVVKEVILSLRRKAVKTKDSP